MPFQTNRRRFLLAGIAVSAGSTMAIGYRWLQDDTPASAGTIEVVQTPPPTPASSPLALQPASPTPGVDLAIEEQLARSGDDDRARSWQRMQERKRTVAATEAPPATSANTIDIAPELGWRP